MATEAQLNANRQNAQFSTGAHTEAGKAASSRNALTFGLFTRHDYVSPEERDIYKKFCETMILELHPSTVLEESLTAEITGASWRLRRCSAVEAELADFADRDPMLDETKEKTIRSLERARASAHSLLHRSVNQFRRLQTDRLTRSELLSPLPIPGYSGIADYKHIVAALNTKQRLSKQSADLAADLAMKDFEAFCEPPVHRDDAELASFCNSPETAENKAPAAAPRPASIPRSAPCPCRSGEKYKRCCGKNAPPVLSTPVRRAA